MPKAMALAGQAFSLSSRLILYILGALAWIFTLISTILTILDAAALTKSSFHFGGLAVATAVLDVLTLGGLVVFFAQFLWKPEDDGKLSSPRGMVVAVSCVALSTLSVALTMGELILLQKHRAELLHAMSHSWTDQLPAHFAMWVFSGVFQAAFYTMGLLTRHRSVDEDEVAAPNSEGRDSVTSETRQIQPAMTLSNMSRAYTVNRPEHGRESSDVSTRSMSSWRDSFSQAVRPMTSRTKLLRRSSSIASTARNVFSDAHSIDSTSQADGFDSWDTSGVDPSVKDSLMSGPSKRTVLRPIPGSRPVSPARALDGPFPPLPEMEALDFAPPRKISESSTRPPSPVVDESHIHPLFRTDSPTPPPAASPGTVVTASPMSGQVIPRPYSRARSNSRTASPSPLSHGQMTDEARARGASTPSRSSSPRRAITPPIPNSILSSMQTPDR